MTNNTQKKSVRTSSIINYSEIARLLGVHRSYVSKIFSNKRKAKDMRKKINEILRSKSISI